MSKPRSGRCGKCGRRYTDRLFNIDEYIRSNIRGIKYQAGRGNEPLETAINRDREKFARHLIQHGYENCERAGCKMAIKPAPEIADG